MKVRLAKIDDKAEILSIIGSHSFKWDKNIARRYYDDYFSNSKNICLKGDEVFVGEEDNRIIGVIGYSLDRYETKNYWLGWFYVRSDSITKGNGKKLLHYVEKKLRGKRIKKGRFYLLSCRISTCDLDLCLQWVFLFKSYNYGER